MPGREARRGARQIPDRWIAAALVLGALVVYNANGREAYPTGDSRPTGLLAFSLLYEHDLDLDEYHPPGAEVSGPIRREGGHVVSNYSPLPAILSLPVYLIALPHRGDMDGDMLHWEPFFSKLAGSIWAALAVAAFFLAARQVATQRAAALTAIVLAFGPFWMSASQTLGQHGLTVLFVSLVLLGVARLERGGGDRWALLAGTACALAVGVRLTNLVLFGAVLLYLVRRRRRSALLFASPAVLVSTPFVLILLATLGGTSGGLGAFGFVGRIGSQLTAPLADGLPGLLVSPGKGLFVWAPVLFLLLLPAGEALATRWAEPGEGGPLEGAARRRLLVLCAVVFALLLVLYSKYVVWWGGRTYGPRYATDLLPFLLLPAAAGLEPWLRRPAFWIPFLLLFLWGAYVQALGAFRYPCAGGPDDRVTLDQERIWSWRETDLGFCSRSLRRPPQDFEGWRRLAKMTWSEIAG